MPDKCGAKKSTRNGRKGGKCGNLAMANGRCRFHGGKSTGPKVYNAGRNALKHGIYSRHFTDEERANRIALTSPLDEEIEAIQIFLDRAIKLAAAQKPDDMETVEVIERDVPEGIDDKGTVIAYYAPREEKKKRPEYLAIVDKLTSRIQGLKLARMELLKADIDDPEKDSQPIGRVIVEVVSAKHSHDHDRAAS